MNSRRLKYGYLGPAGTFTEVTGRQLFGHNSDYEGVPFQTNRRVLEALMAGEIDTALVPIENSMEGAVNDVTDRLIQLEGLWITGEVIQRIEHHLIGLPGTQLHQVKTVISHPQALGQCRQWLTANLPNVAVETVASTANGVKLLGTSGYGPDVVAIASRHTVPLNERVELLVESIHDSQENKTRFLTVGREECSPGDQRCKTSIVISTEPDVSGSLVQALNVLSLFRINMTKIESRPAKTLIGDYLFLIDFMGHHQEPLINQALELLRTEWVTRFRLLGSYPELTLLPLDE